jgi:hypothetical protein
MRIKKIKIKSIDKSTLLSILVLFLSALFLKLGPPLRPENKTTTLLSVSFIVENSNYSFYAEYDPLHPTDDETTDQLSDAEAMRLLEEENDPAETAPPAAPVADTNAAAADHNAGAGSGSETAEQHTEPTRTTMDTADPPPLTAAEAAAAAASHAAASGAAIFKDPQPPREGAGQNPRDGSEPRQSGSGYSYFSGRSNSSSDSDYSTAFSNCDRNELPPLYHTVKKARASALAPRILGGGTDPHFFERFGDFASDPRHIFASHRHNFEKKTNISTSFDPTDMACNTCEFRHPILERGGGPGLTGLTPKCFYLSDQCFPPVLPPSGGGECLAIVRTECGTLAELVSAFLDLTADYEVPVGTVVIFSSLTHLSRVGTSVYAADIVKALSRLREAYGDSVRGLHGFPVMASGLQDRSCIRALREIEVWLSEADKRNQHTLPLTSKKFTEQFLTSSTVEQTGNPPTALGIIPSNKSEHPYRTGTELPASLHSLAKVNIHCLGWEDLPTGLPILSADEELNFLSFMLEELNEKFALQLDVSPCTERSGHSAADSETESEIVIALAGSSHLCRLSGPLADTYLKVVDVSVPGFRISEKSVELMVEDLTAVLADLDDSKTVVVLQPFDNSIFFSCNAHGEKTLTKKGKDGRFHVEGELKLISKEDMKEIFLLLLPLIRAAKGKKIIIMGPMPRYLLARCCDSLAHLTNRGGEDYIDQMIQAIRDVYAWISNTIFMRRIKGVKVFNPTHALGFNDYDVNIDTILELWGDDPVHPTPAAYKVLAEKLAAMAADMLAETAQPADPATGTSKKRAAHREPWIVSSEPVAKRLIPTGTGSGGGHTSSGGHNSGRGGGSHNTGRGGGNRGFVSGNRGRGGPSRGSRGAERGGQYSRGPARGGRGGFRGQAAPFRGGGGRWQRGNGRGWF